MEMLRDIRQIYDNYGFATEILAASLRHPFHVLEAARAGKKCRRRCQLLTGHGPVNVMVILAKRQRQNRN